jgi:D-sedoheptulose 7-phosphate isomerase
MNRAVFFDRDGVVNKYVSPTPRNLHEFVLNNNIGQTMWKLRYLGYKIFIVTNQPDVARGKIERKELEKINEYILNQLPVDRIYMCISDDDTFKDRKPNPGMLLTAAKEFDIDLQQSFMVGDSWKDINAGDAAKCRTIYLQTDYNIPVSDLSIQPDKVIKSVTSIYKTIFESQYTVNFLSKLYECLRILFEQEGYSGIVRSLKQLQRAKGRLFLLGVGGGAGNASHAVADFRKFLNIETYSVSDNVPTLTALTNDEGWNNSYYKFLEQSNLTDKDCVFVFSVGGGDESKNISVNIVNALRLARVKGTTILGIVGKDGGYTKKVANHCIIIPNVEELILTPLVESMQSLLTHIIVTHPFLKKNEATWESIGR